MRTNTVIASVTLLCVLFFSGSAQVKSISNEQTVNQNCQYTLAPLSQAFGAAGGTGSLTVSTTATCEWEVHSTVPWITLTSARNGVGNATILYSVAPSFGGRRGEILLNRRSFTITQAVMACSEPRFKLADAFVTGLGSAQFVLRDFNGDGINDVWGTGSSAPNGNLALTIATGKREGGFNAPATIPLGYKPSSLFRTSVADFNRDGKQDFALAESSNIYVSLNGGNNSMLPAQQLPLSINGWDIAVGDFTGDQYPDVIVGSEVAGFLALFVNDGTGKLKAENVIKLSETVSPALRLASGDFNNDGKLDLFYLTWRSFEFRMLLGNGNGTFQRSQSYSHIDNTISDFVEPRGFALGDVTGDGRVDAVIANSKGLSVVPGLSNGAFGTATMHVRDGSLEAAYLGDFNGDGIADIAARAGTTIQYLRGLGAGRFTTAIKFLTRGAAFNNQGSLTLDWNNDGLIDIGMVSSGDPQGGLAVTFGNRINGFSAPRFRTLSAPENSGIAASSDVNADGLPDLIMVSGNAPDQGGFSIQYGLGNGEFRPGPSYNGMRPVQLEVSDVNQDGAPDIVVANDGRGTLGVWLNNGRGSFSLASEPETNRGSQFFTLADFDNNGKVDLLTTIPNNLGARILTGNGNGKFTVTTQTFTGTGWTTGDFNGDGNQDVAAWTRCGFGTGTMPIIILSGNGFGTFTEATRLSVPDSVQNLSAYDLNGDGRKDLVGNLCTSVSGAYFFVAFANSISFNPLIYFDGSGNNTPPVSDLNGDGLPDLIASTSFSRAYLNRGDGTFQPSLSEIGTRGFFADLNEDGTTDWLYSAGDEYAVIFNQARCPATSEAIITSAASYYSTKVAPNSIAALFGTGLATETRIANTNPLPTSLTNISVSVRDSKGLERNAPLFFVSPNQINFLLPANVEPGLAQVRILRNGSTPIASSVVEVLPVTPGVFSLDATGTGLPAGFVLRVRSNGAQVYEPLAQYNTTLNRYVPVPLDVSNSAEQVFLILYGTGLRNRTALPAVTATIGGLTAQVSYAGPQTDFSGLDQINLRVPAGLAARGDVEVNLLVDGRVTNTLKLVIK